MRYILPLFVFLPLLAQTPPRCAEMAKAQLPGLNLEITKAEWQAAGTAMGGAIPAHCRVEGILDRRTGVAGKPYGIRFALALPENWTGSFLMQGGGGLNGSVAPPVGGVATGGKPALARGFAVVTNDTGHQGQVFDGSFMADQQAALDFAYVANGRVALLAKALIAQYYGSGPKHSYFAGCSTGGREGMIMTQRYPSYFDGVISGAPAMRTGYSNLADRFVATQLNAIAPKNAQGLPDTAKALSDGDRKLIVDSLLQACDERDGLKDGMIWDLVGCGFDPTTLVCKGEKQEGCLSAAQAEAVKKGFAGPKNSRGDAVYSGFLYDTGIAAGGAGRIPGLLNPGPSPVGPPNTETKIDVDAWAAGIGADEMGKLTDSTWVNLTSFAAHGGKVMWFHGASDPWFSALDTLNYFQRMSKATPKAEEFSRIYLVPGMGHCGGGQATDQFDLLTPLVEWVEKGEAPGAVAASGRAYPGRTRPLCAYPKFAVYKGSGDPEKAENFECREGK